ncbi:MAG: chemotaxis protein CheV [Synergistaceae bacterium]|nr:chemotaxis protein CheV [Synergistaceae bacterium]
MQEVKKVTTEVGTNEWQLVVFVLGDQSFAINVDKTREILRWPGCRAIPDAPVALIGITSVRGEVLPMVDLRIFLGIQPVTPMEQSKVIIAEFNEVKLGFVVDAVERIYRIKSEDLDASMTGKYLGDWILYVIKRDSRNVLLLDYEAIVQTISPQLVIQHSGDPGKAVAMMQDVGHPGDYHIIVAEDSPLIRKQVEDALIASGFTSLTLYPDGKAAFDAIVRDRERCDLLITDVEMPRLDGLTLTRRVKENQETTNIPVIVFSSIMSADIKRKAASVGANLQVTKPEITQLVEAVVKVIREKEEKKAQEEAAQ